MAGCGPECYLHYYGVVIIFHALHYSGQIRGGYWSDYYVVSTVEIVYIQLDGMAFIGDKNGVHSILEDVQEQQLSGISAPYAGMQYPLVIIIYEDVIL